MPSAKRVLVVVSAVATMLLALAGCFGPAGGKCLTDERTKAKRVGDTVWVFTDTTFVCRK